MAPAQPHRTGPWALPHKLPLLLGAVRFEHTIFALPLAYVGMLLAADGLPDLGDFIWITVAMAGARTLAMSSNRLIQHKEDAANPRTAGRHLPVGLIKPWEMGLLMALSTGVFIFAASQLNGLALVLAPVAGVFVVLYSYVKYYTWTTHFVLGWADGIAPAGAWIGVTGTLDPEAVLLAFAVACWIGGFDVFYACQDYDFDQRYGVHSIPRRFGIAAALWTARGMHAFMLAALLALGVWMELSLIYYAGWLVAAALLAYEHSLLKPNDLSRLNMAFFNLNGYIALAILLFTALAVVF